MDFKGCRTFKVHFRGGYLNHFTQPSREPYRILIVDDALAVRESLGWLLLDEPGLAVVGDAADGSEAIHQALQLEPDLVILDIELPDSDGFSVTRQLKALPRPPLPRPDLPLWRSGEGRRRVLHEVDRGLRALRGAVHPARRALPRVGPPGRGDPGPQAGQGARREREGPRRAALHPRDGLLR